jgi:hypothetical protein
MAYMQNFRLDDIAERLTGLLPPSMQAIQKELKENFKSVLSASLSRMDLVTREEFDVQCAVLARTRAKLEALEKQVAELEQRAGAKD